MRKLIANPSSRPSGARAAGGGATPPESGRRTCAATWPSADEAGLLALLAKRGGRLGGLTGQTLLRSLGWDGSVLSQDVLLCLREAGLDIAADVKSKSGLAKAQAQFNAWAAETGLPYVHLSRICAMSIGDNDPARELAEMGLGRAGGSLA